MNSPLHRRDFVKRTTLYSFGLAAAPLLARAQTTKSPGEKLVVCICPSYCSSSSKRTVF